MTPKTIPLESWLTKQSVHDYPHGFAKLAKQRLPALFKSLQGQMARPVPVADFWKEGSGPAALIKSLTKHRHFLGLEGDLKAAQTHTLGLKLEGDVEVKGNDFTGLYVLLAGKRPFYVGISRTVIHRLQCHVRSCSHNSASLFYQMVKAFKDWTGPRKDLPLDSPDANLIRDWLKEQHVAILPLSCPVERYAFELYAAMRLQTGNLNSFETH